MEHTKPTRSRKPRLSNIAFELPVNGRSYMVTATPFNAPSGEVFYRISYNNGPVHVFGWDESRNRFAETQKPAHIIPPVIEMGIAARLNDYISEMQEAA